MSELMCCLPQIAALPSWAANVFRVDCSSADALAGHPRAEEEPGTWPAPTAHPFESRAPCSTGDGLPGVACRP